MIVTGIDPGVRGKLVTLDSCSRTATCYDIPFYEGEENLIDWEVAKLFTGKCYLEKVGVRPMFGAAAAFTFGGIYYQLRTLLWGNEHELVTPQAWQGHMLGRGAAGTTKARARAAFERLVKQEHQRYMTKDCIDAFLIANYGLHLNGIFVNSWVVIKG